MSDSPRPRFTALVIFDGLGLEPPSPGNAFELATRPTFERLFRECPWTQLETSGERVGLPEGQMGNSEVGHMTMGAGRIVYQDIVRISKAVRDGELARNPVLVDAFEKAKRPGATLHLLGLLGPGGVHALQEHCDALVDLALAAGVDRVLVHGLLDGRDTPPMSAIETVRPLAARLAARPGARLASLCGRYYTMDRDNRWERVERGYRLLTEGAGERATDAAAALEASYARGVGDEFVEPVALLDPATGEPGLVRDGDVVLFFNFRADRAREITRAFTEDPFEGFARAVHPKVDWICMTRYRADFRAPVLFPPQSLADSLPEVWERSGVKNLRIAETEKYAHVTFFFNGGREQLFEGEERILVPSPKVATYDLQPAMSAAEVARRAAETIREGKIDAMILNFANPDMVGHTGILPAAKDAVEVVDAALAGVLAAIAERDGQALITADHGNCERMIDPETGGPHTAHTLNPVPCILFDSRAARGEDGGASSRRGGLARGHRPDAARTRGNRPADGDDRARPPGARPGDGGRAAGGAVTT